MNVVENINKAKGKLRDLNAEIERVEVSDTAAAFLFSKMDQGDDPETVLNVDIEWMYGHVENPDRMIFVVDADERLRKYRFSLSDVMSGAAKRKLPDN